MAPNQFFKIWNSTVFRYGIDMSTSKFITPIIKGDEFSEIQTPQSKTNQQSPGTVNAPLQFEDSGQAFWLDWHYCGDTETRNRCQYWMADRKEIHIDRIYRSPF
jgi:hypothetical protein